MKLPKNEHRKIRKLIRDIHAGKYPDPDQEFKLELHIKELMVERGFVNWSERLEEKLGLKDGIAGIMYTNPMGWSGEKFDDGELYFYRYRSDVFGPDNRYIVCAALIKGSDKHEIIYNLSPVKSVEELTGVEL